MLVHPFPTQNTTILSQQHMIVFSWAPWPECNYGMLQAGSLSGKNGDYKGSFIIFYKKWDSSVHFFVFCMLLWVYARAHPLYVITLLDSSVQFFVFSERKLVQISAK